VHPLSVVWPGLAITITVLGLNLLGDALREATDPTLTRRRTAAQTHDGGDLMSLVVRNLVDRDRGPPRRRRRLLRRSRRRAVGLIGESGSGKSSPRSRSSVCCRMPRRPPAASAGMSAS
jgi:hypothetical protein